MSDHLYYGILADHVPQDMSMNMLCNSSHILAGKDPKYGMTLCLWYDCPEEVYSKLQNMGAYMQIPLNLAQCVAALLS